MKAIRLIGPFLTSIMLLPVIVQGQSADLDPLVESVQRGCQSELAEHCKAVTPGNGRLLACLYSYQDKLSGRCEYALYDASAQLQRTVAALSYLGAECDADLESRCANIQPGEGRVLQCLKSHQKDLTERCGKALDDVGTRS
jgi:hypothetical protein